MILIHQKTLNFENGRAVVFLREGARLLGLLFDTNDGRHSLFYEADDSQPELACLFLQVENGCVPPGPSYRHFRTLIIGKDAVVHIYTDARLAHASDLR
jgi:hypothetical protein